MKRLFAGILAFVNLFYGSTLAIGQGKSEHHLMLKIRDVSPSGEITVDVINSSSKAIKIWKDSNSWGAARWRVLLIRKGHLETFFQNPDQDFTVNMASFHEIAAGGHIEQKLDLNGGNWCGLGHCGSYNEHGFGGQKIKFVRSDLIVLVYDVPFFPESLSMGVWYGVAATSTIVG